MHSRLVSLVKLTLLPETEMNPRYQLASTLNIQEQVLSTYKPRLMSASRNCDKRAERIHFGQATLIQASLGHNVA